MYFFIFALAFLQLSSCSKKEKDDIDGYDSSQYSGGHGGSQYSGGLGGYHYSGGQNGGYDGGQVGGYNGGHGGFHYSGGHISGSQNGGYDGGQGGGQNGGYYDGQGGEYDGGQSGGFDGSQIEGFDSGYDGGQDGSYYSSSQISGGHGSSHYSGGQGGGQGGSHNSGGHVGSHNSGDNGGGYDSSSPSHANKGNQNSDTFMALKPNEAAFANAFMKAVKSSDILCKVFDLSGVSGSDIGQFVYSFTAERFKTWGNKNPKIPAAFAARPIAQNFYNLPLDQSIKALGNCNGKFLNAVGTLDQSNAQEITDTLLQYLTESAECTFDGTPRSQLLAMGNGFANFLNDIVHMNVDKVNKLATNFGDAFLLESIIDGPGDVHKKH